MIKKIVIDARESGTSTGRYVDKLIEYLHKLESDYDITVLTKAPRLEFMKTIAPNFEVVESNFKEFTFSEQIGLLKQLNSLKADLVHFGITQQPVLYQGKAVTTIHDLTTVRFTNPTKNWLVFKLKQQVYKWVIRQVAKKSEAIIVPSEYVKQDVAQFTKVSPDKITVTYEAGDKITIAAKVVGALDNKRFIMYVGRAQLHKNLNRLAKALEILQSEYPDLRLVLVGKIYANYSLLKKYVAKKAIKNVFFAGYVSDGELRWLYENTAAYVFPSLSEGFGLPALEAMAHGAPVISSKATCLPEIYGDAALYFDPKDIKDMAQKIKIVLDSPKVADKLRAAGPEQAAKYSWKTTAEQTVALYRKVLDDNN